VELADVPRAAQFARVPVAHVVSQRLAGIIDRVAQQFAGDLDSDMKLLSRRQDAARSRCPGEPGQEG
jgi:hypothetical protein